MDDQDYIQNGKKLINPLLSTTRTLELGGEFYLHVHIELVFQQCDSEKHGLKMEDVDMNDLQIGKPHKDYAMQGSSLVCHECIMWSVVIERKLWALNISLKFVLITLIYIVPKD